MELKTIGLTKKFGSKTAVNALNITLTNGVYGLLGANGLRYILKNLLSTSLRSGIGIRI